jgi:ubiquinone/menaquinone biosynthesis C-methylase UbiE
MKNNADIIQRFDEWSRTYDQSRLQILYFERIHKGVLDLVERQLNGYIPKSILDVGCGTARLLRSCRERWPAANLVGVDPSQGMLEVARRLTPYATFYNSSAESLPLPDASMDVVLSTTSFHHWQDQATGVREIARVLRPDCLFCLADIAMPHWLSGIIRHYAGNNPSAWRTFFVQAGLDIVAQKRYLMGHVLVLLGLKHLTSRD